MEQYGFIKTTLEELKTRVERIEEKLIPHNKKIEQEVGALIKKETEAYNKSNFLGIFKRKQLTETEYFNSTFEYLCGFMAAERFREPLYKKKHIPDEITCMIKYGKEEIFLSSECVKDIIRLELFFDIKDDSGYRPQVLLKG